MADTKGNKLTADYYKHPDVVFLSRDLLGKHLCTFIGDELTTGIITETEAYEGAIDKASHAYNNRRTKRTEVMFSEGGIAYVYLCYGIHHLFNVVTNSEDTPHAILVRAIHPVKGLEIMYSRRNLKEGTGKLAGGPGTVSQALGIKTKHSGLHLTGDTIWIESHGIEIRNEDVIIGPRVGVDYAGEDAKLPYRFRIRPGYFDKKK